MNDSGSKTFEHYLDEVKYLEEYSKQFHCGSCGGQLSSSVCLYCKERVEDDKKISEIEKIREQLIKIIQSLPKEIEFNETLNCLYRMKNIDIVTDYLNKINYSDVLEREKKLLDSKLFTSEKLSKKDIEKYEFLTQYVVFDPMEKEQYNLLALKKSMLNLAEFSPLYIEKVFVEIIKLTLKNANLTNINVVIGELDEKTAGLSEVKIIDGVNKSIESKKMIINRSEIKKFLHGDFSVLITIFHEGRHFCQRNGYRESNKPDLFWYLSLKDSLLSRFYEEYYNSNYNNLLFEIDAEVIGINEMINCITLLGMSLAEESVEYWQQKQRELIEKIKNTERFFGDKKCSLEEIFDSFISDKPQILELYPYLKYQYVIENDCVRKLSQEEVLSNYNNFNMSELSDIEKINLQQFFNYVYGAAEQITIEENISHGVKK